MTLELMYELYVQQLALLASFYFLTKYNLSPPYKDFNNSSETAVMETNSNKRSVLTYIQFYLPGLGICAQSASAKPPWLLLQPARQDARSGTTDSTSLGQLRLYRAVVGT